MFAQAQAQGFLGKGSIAEHIAHARAHAAVAFADNMMGADDSHACVDLGSGGGVPGLVIAADNPNITMTLLERSDRRCEFLSSVVGDLGLASTTTVVCMDVADVARDPNHRQNYDITFSRSFGHPAVVSECAAGLLIPGGVLVVSEPPTRNTDRWPAEPLSQLGLRLELLTEDAPHFAVLRMTDLCPDDRPRHWSQLVKRPLYQ